MAIPNIPEIWRAIPDFPDYEISNFGGVRRAVDCVRTYFRLGQPRTRTQYKAGKILRPKIGKLKYPRLTLWRLGIPKGTEVYIHILVCTAFHGPAPSPRHQVAHWDGDRRNIRSDNLRWATPKENSMDTIRHGRGGRGKHSGRKLSPPKVKIIKQLLRAGVSHSNIALQFGVCRENITHINNRRTWVRV